MKNGTHVIVRDENYSFVGELATIERKDNNDHYYIKFSEYLSGAWVRCYSVEAIFIKDKAIYKLSKNYM